MGRIRPVMMVLLGLLLLCGRWSPAEAQDTIAAGGAALPADTAVTAEGYTRPKRSWNFQYMLARSYQPSDYIEGVTAYSIDWETPAENVASLRARGGYPICYFSAGSYEKGRSDAGDFLPSDLGKVMVGWPDERWLDVTSQNVRKIMTKRMELCKSKGFLAVDPDNVDGYANANGVGLTAEAQLAYNTWLADTAHGLGMAAGLKNDLDQLDALTPKFDFFINEQCSEYGECDKYAAANAAGKPVWAIEYKRASFSAICPRQAELGVRALFKKLGLDPFVEYCPGANPFPEAPGGGGGGGGGDTSPPPQSPPPDTPDAWWRPKASDRLDWQIQTSAPFDSSAGVGGSVKVYVLLMWGTSSASISAVAASGATAICYLNAGTVEAGVPDAASFPDNVLGAEVGLQEWWVDVRSNATRAAVKARLELCKSRGYAGVAATRVDAYANANGLGITAADQIAYNTWLADTAHGLGLSIGLVGASGQAAGLAGVVDFFVDSNCVRRRVCKLYAAAKQLDKPVFDIETRAADFNKACKCLATYGLVALQKRADFSAWRKVCTRRLAAGRCRI